jgi:hypothetical protein
MKKLLFSGLMVCGLLLMAASTRGQQLFAYPENKMIIIRWSAANEQFIDRYIVERSTDSVHFTALHEVASKGPFTDVQENAYEDADSYPAGAVSFYRLQTVLKDGGSLYSAAFRVDMDTREMPSINPTVIQQGETLRLDNHRSGRPVTVNFFNAQGTLVGSYLVNGNNFTIATDRLAKGILFYRISDQTHPLIDAGKVLVL